MNRNPFRLALVMALAFTLHDANEARAQPPAPIDIGIPSPAADGGVTDHGLWSLVDRSTFVDSTVAPTRLTASQATPRPEPLTPEQAAALSGADLQHLVDRADFIDGAVATTDLTLTEAAAIYDTQPELIDSIPTSVADDAGGSIAGTTCVVRSRTRYRSALGFVLWSFTLIKTWTYNGVEVTNVSHRHDWNITGTGMLWAFDGIVDRQAWWIQEHGLPHWGHHGERTAQFATWDAGIQITVSRRRAIDGYADGDWITSSGARGSNCIH